MTDERSRQRANVSRVPRLVARVTDAMAIAAGFLVLLTALAMTVAIIARTTVQARFIGLEELSGYAIAGAVLWGQAAALRTGAHVRVDILYSLYPRSARVLLDVLEILLMAILAGALSFLSWRTAIDSMEAEILSIGMLRVPLYLPQGVVAVGLTALFIEAVVLLVSSLLALPRNLRQKSAATG